LVTNGTFDVDTTEWQITSPATHTVTSGEYVLTTTGSGQGASQSFSTVVGKTYVLSADVRNGTASSTFLVATYSKNHFANSYAYAHTNSSTTSRLQVTFTPSTTTSWVYLRGGSGGTHIFDNISVRLADQSYIATRDTGEMYDYDDTQNQSFNMEAGDVIYITGANTNGTTGHYYKVKSTGSINPATASMSTAYYTDLGTADNMSLENPYFKPIPYVTKQAALLIEKDAGNNINNVALPLVNMYGEESVETYEADIFSELGYSQKADRVWTDGTSEFILVGLKGYLA